MSTNPNILIQQAEEEGEECYSQSHFDYCSQVYKKNTWMTIKKWEEGTLKGNMENVPKGHIILSNQIIIWNVISKYHTTTDPTKCHMKIYTI